MGDGGCNDGLDMWVNLTKAWVILTFLHVDICIYTLETIPYDHITSELPRLFKKSLRQGMVQEHAQMPSRHRQTVKNSSFAENLQIAHYAERRIRDYCY